MQEYNFGSINVETSYWDWINILSTTLYKEEYYQNFSIAENNQFSIPNLNKAVSPLRIT